MARFARAFCRSALISLRLIPKPDLISRLVPDHPSESEMEAGTIYVVGGRGYQKWAYFLCPTGNGEIIQLSLMQNRRPNWRIAIDLLERPTVNPSVRQLEGSYAHFWVRKGKVDWCADTGTKPRLRREAAQ